MKTKNLLLFFGISLMWFGSYNINAQIDQNAKKFEPKDVSKIKLHPSLEKASKAYSNSKPEKRLGLTLESFTVGDTTARSGYITIPIEFRKCMDSSNVPKRIRDLKYGLTLDAYSFNKESQAKLGFLGFGNVDIGSKETVIVVEYEQTGTQRCHDLQLFYGVGARLMMHIKSSSKDARINTPQQISASVTFGKADVIFSIKTFGITGPGVARLVKSGTMTENTYTEFLNDISSLIVDAYGDSTKFTIEPQPLFLKQE